MHLFRKLAVLLGTAVVAPIATADTSVVADAKAAATWISTALTQSGYEADFSLQSLKEVDRFIEEQAPNGEPLPNGFLAEQLGSRLFALGAYVGEVLLRAKPGRWVGDDTDPKAEINLEIFMQDGTRAWPVQRVMKRFKNGREESLFAYGLALTTL